jgi:predicted nucleic acid-binding protein
MERIANLQVVATDASVLINLIRANRLHLLQSLPGHGFVVPAIVAREVRDPAQSNDLRQAIRRGYLRRVALASTAERATYFRLRALMGKGEAACLAIAEHRGWLIASDEKRRLRREAITRLGEGRLLTTEGIFVLAIRADILTIEEADEAKALLEQHRFRMAFRSFRDLIDVE